MSTTSGESRQWRRLVARWVALYAGMCAMSGLLAGLFWVGVVRLPTFTIRPDGRAIIGERGLAAFFATDSWFIVAGVIVGMGLGWLAWRWFRPLGWATSVIAGIGALLAAVVCWGFGTLLGPGPLDERMAAAKPGSTVPIAFELSAHSALAAWPFAAMIPLLVLASVVADPDDPPRERRIRRPARDSART